MYYKKKKNNRNRIRVLYYQKNKFNCFNWNEYYDPIFDEERQEE